MKITRGRWTYRDRARESNRSNSACCTCWNDFLDGCGRFMLRKFSFYEEIVCVSYYSYLKFNREQLKEKNES